MAVNSRTPKTVWHQGESVPVCALETVDFSRLLSQEPEEVQRLLRCCQTQGFFYLDLQGLDGRRILDDEQKLLQIMRDFFHQPTKTKDEVGLPDQPHGFEPVGHHAGAVENTKDGYEILKVSRDELASGSTTLPSVLKDDIKLLESFLAESNIITKTMLACLSNAIGLKDLDRFESFHRNDHKSNSTLALLHYIPTELTGQCVGHRKHTDVGSLTLLFSEQWGLQVIPTGNSSWEFVAPRPGHAIVNVGDSLRFASGNSFNSCIHQVVPMDRAENRYSIAYFLRPESEKDFKDSEGRRVTASQWHDEKYEVFGQTYSEQAANTILTGGM